MSDSVILSWLKRVGCTLIAWYNESGYARIVARIEAWFSKLFHHSFAYTGFVKDEGREVSGVFVTLIRKIFAFFHWVFVRPFAAVGRAAQNSAVVRFIRFMAENWYAVPLRAYGIAGLAFSVTKAVVDLLFSGGLTLWNGVIAGVSVIALLFSQSMASLYSGSRIVAAVGLPKIPGKTQVEIPLRPMIIIAAAIGAGVGILTGFAYWYVAIAAVAGLIFMIMKPKWAILLAVALFPVLPTMAVAALVGLCMFCMFVRYLASDKKEITLDVFDLVLVGMCVMFAYGTVFSHAVKSSLPIGMMYVLMAGSFFCFRRMIDKENTLYGLLDVMIAMATLVAVYGIYQRFFGVADTTWQDTEMFEDMTTRVYSTFDNPNVLGEYLLITIPITLARFYYTDRNNNRLALVVSLAAQLACMVFTYSRGCWIGLVVEIGIFLMFRGKKLLGAAVLCLLVLPFVMPQSIIERLSSIGNTGDSSTSYRVFIWEGTLRMLKDYGLTGVGLGQDAFNGVYPYYALSAVVAPHPHNLFLEVMCESGILGLIMFLSCIVCFYRALGKCHSSNKKLYTVAVAFGAGMTGYLLQGMFDNVWYNYRIFFFFFIMLGMAAVLKQLAKKQPVSAIEEGAHE